MTLYATGTTFNYFSYAAAILRGSNASFSDTFVGDFKAKVVFKMLDARGNGGMYAFRGGLADFEGNSPECYWQVERHANTPITSLRVEDFALGKVAAEGVHVRLTDSVMAQGNPPSHCYAAIANVPAVDALRVEKADCWKVDMWG